MGLPASKAAPQGAAPAPATSLDYQAPVATVLAVAPEARFVYRWSPDQWELVTVGGKPTLIPQLSKILLTKGVNGIPMARKGDGLLQARSMDDIEVEAVQKAQLKGWRVIAPNTHIAAEFLPAGTAPGPLRRVVMTVSGEERWHDCWEQHLPTAMGGVKVTYHRDLYHKWMASMVEGGAFGTPPAHVVPEIRAQLETMRSNREARLSTVDSAIRASRLAPLDAQLKALDAIGAPAHA